MKANEKVQMKAIVDYLDRHIPSLEDKVQCCVDQLNSEPKAETDVLNLSNRVYPK